MQTALQHGIQAREGVTQSYALPHGFISLEIETRAGVDTATAAHHLNRQPQTLRGWASTEAGPLRPMRINGRLMWSVADLRRVLGVKV